MEILISKTHRYELLMESVIKTPNSRIYQARDLDLNRIVCVKVINLKSKGNNRKIEVENIMKEIRVMVSVGANTPFIPTIFEYDINEDKNEFYIVMQWIKGKTLRDKLNVGHIKENQLIKWMRDLCKILILFNKKNMSHKDIKPENIMIDDNNNLYLIDFNITLSNTNLIEGTKYYKAPEMESDSKTTDRSKVDIFAIGVMMYEYYSGHVPKRGEDYDKKGFLAKEFNHFINPVSDNILNSSEKNELIKVCMSYNPRNRVDCTELNRRLEKINRRK